MLTYILPQRKIIKWITLFLFVGPADQNSTLGITRPTDGCLQRIFSDNMRKLNFCKNWIYFSYQALNRDKTTLT